MMTLKDVVERRDTTAGRVFALVVQALIVVSVVSFSIETLPGVSAESRRVLGYIESTTVVLFTIEYSARIAVADRRLDYAFSFWGIIDLLAILPFYLALGVDLRAVRAFRLLRLFRLLKLVRYSRAIRHFGRAFRLAREELVLFGMCTLVVLYLSGVGLYYFERDAQPQHFASVFHSLWWAVATLTTVGYGDVYPITVGGRVFTFFVLMVGLGIVALPSSVLASALSATREDDDDAGEN